MKDKIFTKPIDKQFEFDSSVASVFDDMIGRSVPFYDVSLGLIADILSKLLPSNAKLIDLGCSTATSLISIYNLRDDLKLFGVDNSDAMIQLASQKSKAYGAGIELKVCDILEYELDNFDAVLLNYTLQFIRPIKRETLVKNIYNGLNDNGFFIFSEKIIYEDKKFAKQMIEIYEQYKENQGYSRYEISQKREALENVLIPYTEEENKTLVLKAGFKRVESIFKWGNFMSFIAFK
ncbi:carboxy-S-adenosyl-L-methionine synthase CmoA [Campylobacter pinnipediorum]|uniref:carboxy-S-adenosyl-L-methionine synthase CmoA n=1 Tax=Campylobacter pinnipediorum TaxID=1965231 RepID=UPI00099503FB|nr:carboxy-S-adenosyl-L-methionine synthase CmoA [Campylobacter pinnipediorum]AQW83143.1 carboxy-S-adenosyl-L-methionine synthase [Campylobacter pinnipediorum subsp. pinnipediorum]OPA79576.1 tRNA (uridine-5-oxyacetic acid methyl ester)(34) synthase TrmP [Campylobacter pinnipediorum subsp. pinnipediorum]